MIVSKPGKTFSARIHDLPLRHKLILPFLLLALFGTFSLVWIAILSQNKIISSEEEQRLYGHYHAFLNNMELRGRWAVSLAETFAHNPQVASALADKDRMRLIELCYPAYRFMKEHYGIVQLHFETSSGRSFLRLHRLHEFGDELESYRKQVRDALKQGKSVYGLEKGRTSYGVRGMAPVKRGGRIVGTVEVGFAFGPIFLKEIQRGSNMEITVLALDHAKSDQFVPLAGTVAEPLHHDEALYHQVHGTGTPDLIRQTVAGQPFAILVGPIRDYAGQTVALVEIGVNRSKTLQMIGQYRQWMLGLGFLGMMLSVWAIYVVSLLFTRPIARMVMLAKQIAKGRQVRRIDERPSGELGELADALDEMLTSLEESRKKIKDYADTLERRVRLRTRALRESEEKYRTLVENVPLVVYRLVENGRTVFINGFVEELVGVSSATATENQGFWKEKVYREDRDRIWPMMDKCLNEGKEFKEEYRIRHANGKFVYVLDHALPVLDENGRVQVVDGILVNVSDRHRLQQQILQTEELRTLSEISARLAHEIRNPLAIAGGFARRLVNKLPPEDPNRPKVEIILKEVARLEKLLEKSLAYLRPFELALSRFDLNVLVQGVVRDSQAHFQEHRVEWEAELTDKLPSVLVDVDLLQKALVTIIHSMLSYCRPDESLLEVETALGESSVSIEITVFGIQVSEDDIEHFFYPFTSRMDETQTLDLPLAKMIIHKHRGVVELARKGLEQLTFSLSLPLP